MPNHVFQQPANLGRIMIGKALTKPLWLCLALLLPVAQADTRASTVDGQAIEATASVSGPIWKVSHSDAPHPLFMVGTMHLARSSDLPLPSVIYQALDNADQVYFELDMSDQAALMAAGMGLAKAGRLPNGTLKDFISPELYAQTIRYAEDNALPLTFIRGSRPWLAAILIQLKEAERIGLSTRYGIDNHLATRAKSLNKKIGGLESPEAQITMMSTLSEDDQALFLLATLDEVINKPEWMLTLADAWKAGDTQLISPYLESMRRDVPAVYANLLANRNAAWMKVLLAEMPKQRLFIAVGLMHMLGPDGLIAEFERAGYHVEQL